MSEPNVTYPKAILLYWDTQMCCEPEYVREWESVQKALEECRRMKIEDLYESYDPEGDQFMGLYVPIMILVPEEVKVELRKHHIYQKWRGKLDCPSSS